MRKGDLTMTYTTSVEFDPVVYYGKNDLEIEDIPFFGFCEAIKNCFRYYPQEEMAMQWWKDWLASPVKDIDGFIYDLALDCWDSIDQWRK